MKKANVDELLADARRVTGRNKLPPVDTWNPPLSGDIDIVITASGEWFHEGGLIARDSLVKLFASILKKEGDNYFLVTPVEKWRIHVEDVPFTVIAVDVICKDGQQALLFTTLTGDAVIASREYPLRVSTHSSGEPSPYLMVRGGMEGRLNRNVFYQLADIAEREAGGNRYGVWSLGEFFPMEE